MSSLPLLDWAVLAVSLFNTILLLWLGSTVLLNAERRTFGLWLAGGGLLLGAAFFLSHSAILGLGLYAPAAGLDFWWRIGWLPVVLAPLAWTVVMAWYTGYLFSGETDRPSPEPGAGRRRIGLAFLLGLGALMISLLAFANPLPSFRQAAALDLSAAPSLGGVPVVILIYPLYILLCIGLALDFLRRPAPAIRLMGDLARRRARPWLMAATWVLLLVSVLVGWAMVWVVNSARGSLYEPGMGAALARLDLLVAGLIAAAVLLVGQAVVSYEIFTGHSLPRRGLARYWRRTLLLAAGLSGVAAAGLVLQVPPVYSLLLALLLVTVFFALLSWRSFAERQRLIASLRPFLATPRLAEALFAGEERVAETPSELDAEKPFAALCARVLGARRAYLIALGPLAPLSGPPLAYPPGSDLPTELRAMASAVAAGIDSPNVPAVSLPAAGRAGGVEWAVPLWSERGLAGLLFLGEKADGGLYTQEEIEIARAAGERLVDARASAEMARRLFALQRRRLASSGVLDRRIRRTLHDEVLPDLHAALLTLNDPAGLQAAAGLLGDLHRRVADLLHDLPAGTAPDLTRLGLVGALRKVVSDQMAGVFESVDWQIDPDFEPRAAALPELWQEVLYYAAREAMRNAARHGRGSDPDRPLRLRVTAACRVGLALAIADDGVGLPPEDESGPASEGAGQGLALHGTLMAVIGGTLAIDGQPGEGTTVTLALPASGFSPSTGEDETKTTAPIH